MPKPLPSNLALDQFNQERWDAGHMLGRLYEAAASLPDRTVLVRSTQRHEIQSMLAFRGVTVADRTIATIDLPNKSLRRQLPYNVARYVQVMDEATQEVRTAPVGYVLKRVVLGLAGLSEEAAGSGGLSTSGGLPQGPVSNDQLPWRTTPHWFGESAQDAYLVAAPPGADLRAGTEQLFEWMDAATGMTAVDKLSRGAYQLFTLNPFTNTTDLLHAYITLELVKSRALQGQIVSISELLDRNQARLHEVHREVVRTGDVHGMVGFFADGLAEQCGHQLRVVRELARLPQRYIERYWQKSEAGKRRDGFARMLAVLPRFQIVTSELIAHETRLTPKRVRELLRKAEKLEFVEHVETRRQAKIYEVKGVRHAIDLYAGRARHRGRLDLQADPADDSEADPVDDDVNDGQDASET